jgi:hypothetical protein
VSQDTAVDLKCNFLRTDIFRGIGVCVHVG